MKMKHEAEDFERKQLETARMAREEEDAKKSWWQKIF